MLVQELSGQMVSGQMATGMILDQKPEMKRQFWDVFGYPIMAITSDLPSD